MPNLEENLFLSSNSGHGYNIKRKMESEVKELKQKLDGHLQDVSNQLSTIMVDAVRDSIESAAKQVDWDKQVAKDVIIEPS